MPFIRSNRTDRRRRVMREAVAADAGVAVESVRAKQRRRMHDQDSVDDNASHQKRDPGYSHAVRRACQLRLVQLIPVRRSSLTLSIIGMWTLWSMLMLAHYFVYVNPISHIGTQPLALLVHLRSTHGIAHWLGGTLWMLTALASLMIFQLRKHKLDDYRARYRVWGLLAIAALVSSFDVSSSGLYLLGTSIDGWARREVGYSGWAIVLATFATLVGGLGLRICSEIKTSPMSVAFWLCGLTAWAFSALLGTELMATPWSKTTTDMVVGGAWLAGILSVFLAAGIYLRHIYIQAQKRFILRNGMLSQGKGWKLPRFVRRDRVESEDDTPSESENDSDQDVSIRSRRNVRSWLPWKRRSKTVDESTYIAQPARRRTSREDRGVEVPDFDQNGERADSRLHPRSERPEPIEKKTKRRWLKLPRWKSDPRLGDDYSDIAAEQRKRDEGFTEPYGKKRGWFSKSKPSTHIEQTSNRVTDNRQKHSYSNRVLDKNDETTPDFQEVPAQRRSWWKRRTTTKQPESQDRPFKTLGFDR